MIQSLRVTNYRCLRDVTLSLGAFTVVVGPNASGKTALADALVVDGFDSGDHWRGKKDPPSWSLRHDGGQAQTFRNPKLIPVRRAKYVLQPRTLRSGVQANEVYHLAPDGQNIANLFDTLTREQQEAFVADFVKLVPVYADIKARALRGEKRLQFEDLWERGLWYEPHQVSDGTLLAAAFVALVYQRDTPDLIVIEDPDHGLHPYLLQQVVELLRAVSAGAIGPRPVQVVCTTHSKALLDYLEPNEARFISRDRETGETKMRRAPTDNPKWREVYSRFGESLGDLWMTGSLGGVPGK